MPGKKLSGSRPFVADVHPKLLLFRNPFNVGIKHNKLAMILFNQLVSRSSHSAVDMHGPSVAVKIVPVKRRRVHRHVPGSVT